MFCLFDESDKVVEIEIVTINDGNLCCFIDLMYDVDYCPLHFNNL